MKKKTWIVTHSVVCQWDDASGHAEELEPGGYERYDKYTAGYLIDDGKEGVRIASELNGPTGKIEYITDIPRGMIVTLRRTKLKEPIILPMEEE